MAQYILLNTVNIPPTGPVYAGTLLDDLNEAALIARIPNAGGQLEVLPNAALEEAGVRARAARAAGNSEACDEIMLAARAVQPLATGSVDAAAIEAGAVTEAKLAADAVTTGKIAPGAVGNTDLAADVVTTDKIAAGAVEEADLAADAVTADKVATGAIGTSEIADDSVAPIDMTTGHMQSSEYPSTSNGASTLLPAVAFDRAVTITVKTTETFADNTGTQPTFEIGETGDADKFAPATEFTNDTASPLGATYSGVLSAGAALLVTAVQATVDGTGAIQATATASRNS